MNAFKLFLLGIFVLVLSFCFLAGCSSNDDDDGDENDTDDDVSDDDSADDDSADDDSTDDDSADDDDDDDNDDDDVFSCDNLTDQEIKAFTKIFCAGASYSNPMFGSSPFTPDQLDKLYHGKILEKVWENLEQCVDYIPELWIYWYDDVDLVSSDVTIFWAVDAFFHYLDIYTLPTPEKVRKRVSDYLDALFIDGGLEEGVWFITGNVPKMLMVMAGYIGNRDLILQIMQEEVDKREYAVMIDFNYYMEKLLAKKVIYNDELIGFFDVIQLDFLHATEFGHQLIADLYILELNKIYPEMMIPLWSEFEILD